MVKNGHYLLRVRDDNTRQVSGGDIVWYRADRSFNETIVSGLASLNVDVIKKQNGENG